MSDKKINLDTSVLMNYVFASLPGELEEDKGCKQLIDGDSFYTVIGGKAKSEFTALCKRRYNLYDDVVTYLQKTDNEIFDYKPRDRDIHTSSNDRDHFRKDIQMKWYDMDRREQLSMLRRCLQDLEVFQVRVPEKLIDQCFPKQNHDELLQRFRQEISVGHDCEILVDAVEISRKHAVATLVAVDSDITDSAHVQLVSDIIEDILGETELLEIVEPNDAT